MPAAEEVLDWALETFGAKLALSTSFQKEGMVLLDMAVRRARQISILTLDTGRLPEETYAMMETVRERYGVTIRAIPPEAGELEQMVTARGPNLMRRDIADRMLCCQIRKVRPLAMALSGFEAVLVGLRRGQSDLRANLQQVDREAKPVKISPLADWTVFDVESYTAKFGVPVHPLYASGYRSIGCAPCTRATLAGESERAGRWWWEQDAEKECGLHFTPDGRARRRVDILLEEVLIHSHG